MVEKRAVAINLNRQRGKWLKKLRARRDAEQVNRLTIKALRRQDEAMRRFFADGCVRPLQAYFVDEGICKPPKEGFVEDCVNVPKEIWDDVSGVVSGG